MSRSTKSLFLFLSGLLISVLPVAVAVISYFPVWSNKGAAAVISGFSLLLLLIAAMPLFKAIKSLTASFAVWSVWLIIFILFAALGSIADEMKIISFVGFISNLIGTVFFKLSKKIKDKEE